MEGYDAQFLSISSEIQRRINILAMHDGKMVHSDVVEMILKDSDGNLRN